MAESVSGDYNRRPVAEVQVTATPSFRVHFICRLQFSFFLIFSDFLIFVFSLSPTNQITGLFPVFPHLLPVGTCFPLQQL